MNFEKIIKTQRKINLGFSVASCAALFLFLVFPFFYQYSSNLAPYNPHWFRDCYLIFAGIFFAASQIYYWRYHNIEKEDFLPEIKQCLKISIAIAILWPALWFFPIHKRI